MSKELIISASRHETRVAVLEEDQVVEIFYQRENEYSLAGSIHKGRVTRVLPGMQSAFVDIGLERDAFLYVSDFFEDNDEYDKIVTSVEEKILKLDRPAQQPAPVVANLGASATATAVSSPMAEEELAAPPAAAESALPSLAPPVGAVTAAPMQERRDERGGDRGDRDQRGRRGRRRRGHKGGGGGPGGGGGGGGRPGGLPESKYYSPRAESEARPEPREEPAPVQPQLVRSAPVVRDIDTAGEFLVLPGESLAKHRRGSEPEPHFQEIADEPRVEVAVEAVEVVEVVETAEVEAVPQPEAAIEATPKTPEPVFETLAEIAAEPHEEPRPELAEAVAEVIEEEAEEEAAAEAAACEIEEVEAPSALDEAAEVETGEEFEAGEEGDIEEPATEDSAEPEVEAIEEEGPEPARIPTSLTATLREQGSRYPHRVSRRSRRRGRDGRGPAPEPGQQRPPQQETRQVEGRPVEARADFTPAERPERGPRPERTERPERAERSEQQRTVPSISDLLKEGQEIIVQIAKEP